MITLDRGGHHLEGPPVNPGLPGLREPAPGPSRPAWHRVAGGEWVAIAPPHILTVDMDDDGRLGAWRVRHVDEPWWGYTAGVGHELGECQATAERVAAKDGARTVAERWDGYVREASFATGPTVP